MPPHPPGLTTPPIHGAPAPGPPGQHGSTIGSTPNLQQQMQAQQQMLATQQQQIAMLIAQQQQMNRDHGQYLATLTQHHPDDAAQRQREWDEERARLIAVNDQRLEARTRR